MLLACMYVRTRTPKSFRTSLLKPTQSIIASESCHELTGRSLLDPETTPVQGITILQWCTEDAVTKVLRERDVFDIQMHLYTARFVGSRRIRDACRVEFMYTHTSVLHTNVIQLRRRMNVSNKQGLTTAP